MKMGLHSAADIARNAQRAYDAQLPGDNEEAYQFACDQVAQQLESELETAQVVATLSQSSTALNHLLSHSVPPDLLPYVRELADLVRDMRSRVETQMDVFTRGDEMEDAA